MVCEQARERMMQAIDGELTPQEVTRMEEHIHHCPDCQEEWEQLQALEHLLRRAPLQRPPAGFTGRLMARIDRRRRARRAVAGSLALALGTLVIAALLLGPALTFLSSLASVAEPCILLLLRLSEGLVILVESLLLTANALFIPVAFLAVCGLGTALFANLAWLAVIRRLRYRPAMPSNL